MNNFQNMQTGEFNLKADYEPTKTPGQSNLADLMKKRRLKLADTKLGPQDQFNPEPRIDRELGKVF